MEVTLGLEIGQSNPQLLLITVLVLYFVRCRTDKQSERVPALKGLQTKLTRQKGGAGEKAHKQTGETEARRY